MRLNQIDYHLPPELIAQHPAPERDGSRLMVVHRERGSVEHRKFRELPEFLAAEDILVANNTRVVPARLFGHRRGHTGAVEMLFVRGLGGQDALVMAKPAKKLPIGTVVELGKSREPVEVVAEHAEGRRTVRFEHGVDIAAFLNREGHIPLPPYIQREDTEEDRRRYQTVFAEAAGAVAAPTAGLHFTPGLLDTLEEQGVGFTHLTLHVGPGTFVPVTAEDPRDHELEAEAYAVSPETAGVINRAKQGKGRVVAVGTTSVRTLETIAVPVQEAGRESWAAAPGSGFTSTFIYPPYEFKLVDALITNFHLPKSSLLLLVAAFTGEELLREAYAQAIAEKYRFYSYGDAMVIL